MPSPKAHVRQEPVLDAYRTGCRKGTLRYAGAGEPYTPESLARFKQMAEGFRSASVDLYNQERAKGTDSADIFDKLWTKRQAGELPAARDQRSGT